MQNQQCQSYLSSSGELDAHLFDSSADCIKIVDLDGRLQRLNPGTSHALEIEDLSTLQGLPWDSLWPPESRDLVTRSVAQAVAGQRSQFGALCPTAKGNVRWWDVVVHPIRNAQGEVCEIMAISRDVTELYATREALREAVRQKDEFLLVLAHELRNPLSATAMAATMLETQVPDEARVRQLARVIGRQVSHMSTLVEDLIDVARIARGDVQLKLDTLDMRTLIDDVVEQLQNVLRAKRHTVTVNAGAVACLVNGDHVRLIQALGNLLGNAARYTPADGHIEIAVQCDQDEMHVVITDNGIGISPENMLNIFERYSQVDPTSDRSSSGLGLGLSLVSKIAQLHGGRVAVHSDGANLGSAFTLTLPRLG